MSFLALLVVLVVIGVVVWAITTYIPMDGGIKNIIRIVGIVIAVLYVLSAFGIFHSISSVQVPAIGGTK